ncbi:mmge/prpd family protein-like protein [Macrophomina phaseolina]|uniref:Mmge/prpd family protein-like protein n=1 Tax=Macrophomina phaseolina TaxID=35725 RepID=A0ABQ8GCU4_9PEZI|nr:mmge/prpd family protein-like protein [Macrophomina phaseolina]
MATSALAVWAHALRYQALPHAVVDAAVRSFYNWAGCAIGGCQHPAAAIARASLSPFAGPPTSAVLGTPGRADAQSAALFNGISSHVHDYDDTHLDTIIHPTGPVASALLAAAEWKKPVAGRDFILALVAGIEAECKAGLAVWPDHYNVGWHITSTAGSIGAAVAVGKLLGLDVHQLQWAIGIAATQVTGVREQFGSMTKSFHPGRAAQNGLLAAVLASNGYDSSLQSLEARRGWANVVSTSNDIETLMQGLGKTWEIEKNSFKPFPCGIVIHPIIDGCIQVRQALHAAQQEKDVAAGVSGIEKIELSVHPLVLELTGKKYPKTGLEGKFSVFHGAAVGLLYGKATPAQYEYAVVQDSTVVALRDKINATIDSALRPDEAHVKIQFKDGSVHEKHVDHAVGSLEVKMTDDQLEEKFVDQCSPVLGTDKAREASEALWRLQEVSNLAELTSILG